jgi:hypothetical protein
MPLVARVHIPFFLADGFSTGSGGPLSAVSVTPRTINFRMSGPVSLTSRTMKFCRLARSLWDVCHGEITQRRVPSPRAAAIPVIQQAEKDKKIYSTHPWWRLRGFQIPGHCIHGTEQVEAGEA